MELSPETFKCYVPTTRALDPTGPGALSGVRVAVKDLFSVAGHTSSFGHAQWRATHEPSSEHAAVVARLLSAGGAITGLTKMDQLAYSLIGNVGEGEPPVNPFDPECFCGGSSSGSASAVAGGLADLGVGTDTAGSIRVPAAACGLFSLRPTHDCIDKEGALPLAPTLDVVGLLAKQPKLLTTAFTVLGPPLRSETRARRTLLAADLVERLDVSGQDTFRKLAQRVADVVDSTVTEVEVASLVNADIGDLFARIQGREIWQQHADWISLNATHLADDVQARLRRCEALSRDPAEVKSADTEARRSYTDQFNELIDGDALLILPVVPRRGPLRSWTPEELIGYRAECFRLTAPSSLTGAPQVVLPVLANGGTVVPAGVVGGRDSDLLLLSVLDQLADSNGEVSL